MSAGKQVAQRQAGAEGKGRGSEPVGTTEGQSISNTVFGAERWLRSAVGTVGAHAPAACSVHACMAQATPWICAHVVRAQGRALCAGKLHAASVPAAHSAADYNAAAQPGHVQGRHMQEWAL